MKVTKRQLDNLVKEIYGYKCKLQQTQIDEFDRITKAKNRFLILETQPNFVEYIKDEFFANTNSDLHYIIKNRG